MAFPYVCGGIAIAFGGACAWKYARRGLLQERPDLALHRDDSAARVSAPPLLLVFDGEDGKARRALAQCTAEGLDELRVAVLQDLDAARPQLKAKCRAQLRAEMGPIFGSMDDGVGRFADWYFRYATTYKLLTRAIFAAAGHAKNFGASESVSCAVQRELEEYICTQFLKIVLQPERNDARCQTAFKTAADACRADFRETVSASVQRHALELFGDANGVALEVADASVEVLLDWHSQAFKVQAVAAAYERSPEMSLSLVVAGAAAGKAVGAAAGKAAAAAAGKASAATASKAVSALGAKLAAPFVIKAAGLATPALATTGAAAGGPAGALAGVVAGLAADMLLNAGAELVQRDGFERDTREAVAATEEEWERAIGTQLELAAGAWCDEAAAAIRGWSPTALPAGAR